MTEKFKVKVGESIRVVTGRHRNSNLVVKRIDRKKNKVFLENVDRVISVMNRKERRRQTKEVFSSVHISNIGPTGSK